MTIPIPMEKNKRLANKKDSISLRGLSDFRKVETMNRSKTKTIAAHTIPADVYTHHLSVKVEIAYTIEKRPSRAGTKTKPPYPACLMCSDWPQRSSTSRSDPAAQTKKLYSGFFKEFIFLRKCKVKCGAIIRIIDEFPKKGDKRMAYCFYKPSLKKEAVYALEKRNFPKKTT